jgi:hypothetical protein
MMLSGARGIQRQGPLPESHTRHTKYQSKMRMWDWLNSPVR